MNDESRRPVSDDPVAEDVPVERPFADDASVEEAPVEESVVVEAVVVEAPVEEERGEPVASSEVIVGTVVAAAVVDDAAETKASKRASGVAPGWYPNPNSASEERYWDGEAWTDEVRPMVVAPDPALTDISPKSRAVAAILAFLIGALGVHRFYVGKVGSGFGMIAVTVFTLGTLGWVWPLIDFIMILVGSFRDKENRLLLKW